MARTRRCSLNLTLSLRSTPIRHSASVLSIAITLATSLTSAATLSLSPTTKLSLAPTYKAWDSPSNSGNNGLHSSKMSLMPTAALATHVCCRIRAKTTQLSLSSTHSRLSFRAHISTFVFLLKPLQLIKRKPA